MEDAKSVHTQAACNETDFKNRVEGENKIHIPMNLETFGELHCMQVDFPALFP